MQYIDKYQCPLGEITMAADENGLTGLWFVGQKYYGRNLDGTQQIKELPVFGQTKEWLDLYFQGENPDMTIPVHMIGTKFQQEVWEVLQSIPYGRTVTYGDIARKLQEQFGYSAISAQAVGGAVGRNPIAILIPCHRVIGANGSLTGYAAGIEKKKALLLLEQRGSLDAHQKYVMMKPVNAW